MKRFKNLFLLVVIIGISSAFSGDKIINNHDVVIEKSITEISKNLYLVTITVSNGNKINGLAKYQSKLPLSADFIKSVAQDKNVRVKINRRKLNMIWMHLQTNTTYNVSFQISSKKSIDKLKMKGEFLATHNSEIFSFEETSQFMVK